MDQINDPGVTGIGGAPQLVKIYRHANTLPFNTIWPFSEIDDGRRVTKHHVTHLGRPLLSYERTEFLSLDSRTKAFIEPWNVQAYVLRLDSEESVRSVAKLRSTKRAHAAVLACTLPTNAANGLSRLFRAVTTQDAFDRKA